jgi:hypothetical protein
MSLRERQLSLALKRMNYILSMALLGQEKLILGIVASLLQLSVLTHTFN